MNKKIVHFMGICGSGAAAIALLAVKKGFIVSGCDVEVFNYYAKELISNGIEIYNGHDENHIKDADIVAISPAILDIDPENIELLAARRKGILMTWQEFMGKYLHEDMKVIAIAGTHGKTTTTFMIGDILTENYIDPYVLGGSVFKKWGVGSRVGSSNIFVCEADEFNRNFLSYYPSIAVINNIEMDHPEYYESFDDMLDAYKKFVLNLIDDKILIVNLDSIGVRKLLNDMNEEILSKHIKIITYGMKSTFNKFYEQDIISCKILEKNMNKTLFEVTDCDGKKNYSLSIPGEYNVFNALSAICVSKVLGIEYKGLFDALQSFTGVGRRFDLVGNMKNVPVYDDYAHHPTEISSVLNMCKEYYKNKKIVVVFEPHQISRLRLFFEDYINALEIADTIIVTQTHIGREIRKNLKPISEQEWIVASKNNKIIYEENIERIKGVLKNLIDNKCCDMILVIGAANSYKISRYLCNKA